MPGIGRIVPREALLQLAADPTLPSDTRAALRQTARLDRLARFVRRQNGNIIRATAASAAAAPPAAAAPVVSIYDCRQTSHLPGTLVADPANSADPMVRRLCRSLADVLEFLRVEFGRNSLDDRGISIIASVHYAATSQAFWNGSQLAFGDGDGQGLLDFTRSSDVVAHELVHGATQFALRLNDSGQPAAIGESISDIFGAMFQQRQRGQNVDEADWLIGREIIGPELQARGYRCLRDLADPRGAHCLWPQVVHMSQYQAGMDPHVASGIANLAFHRAAMALGGRSWERAGVIWYAAIVAGAQPGLRLDKFANRTRAAAAQLHGAGSPEFAAVDQGWAGVGL